MNVVVIAAPADAVPVLIVCLSVFFFICVFAFDMFCFIYLAHRNFFSFLSFFRFFFSFLKKAM